MPAVSMPRSKFEDKLHYSKTHVDPPGGQRDPFPIWAELRNQPLKIIQPDKDFPPLVHVYRYKDVAQIAADVENYSSVSNQQMQPLGEYTLVAIDPPAHTYYRGYLLPLLAPNAIVRWSERLIPDAIDMLLTGMVERGRADLVAQFTFHYPALVVLRIIGFPREEFEQFQNWAAAISNSPAEPEPGWKAADEVIAYLKPYLDGTIAAPEDSILYSFLHKEIDGKRLTHEEIQSFILQLVVGGLDTTYRSLGTTLMLLLDRLHLLERVRNDRKLVRRAIEESLRFEGPAVIANRVTTQDTELNGLKIPKGTWVIPVRSSANRDPEFIDDPDTFSLDRGPYKHLAFGSGIHICLGQHLARLELQSAINALFDHLPNLRWDEPEKERLDPHIRGSLFRSPTALPVMWDV